MHLILRYQNGVRVQAILLAASRDRMRLVIPNCTETIEFRLKDKTWISGDGEVAEIDAMIADESSDLGHFGFHRHTPRRPHRKHGLQRAA